MFVGWWMSVCLTVMCVNRYVCVHKHMYMQCAYMCAVVCAYVCVCVCLCVYAYIGSNMTCSG